MKYIEYDVKSAISKSNLPELDYAVNPYTGCQHRCIYCFAIDFTKIEEAREKWGEVVYVKRNFTDVLKKQIKGMKRGITGLSSITDPYQPAEAIYGLTRESIRILLSNGFRVTVQTKSPLASRDMGLFVSHRDLIDVGVTITTIDQKKALEIETQTPSPAQRIRLLERLHSSGIKSWIFIGPIIKGFNDSKEEVERIFQVAKENGSRIIYDAYSPYKNSSIFMRNEFRHPVPERTGNTEWRKGLDRMMLALGDDFGVRINSQDDEWKVARGEGIGTFPST